MNTLKQKLIDKKTSFGYFIVSGSPLITELAGDLPLDWLIIDMEAGPINWQETLGMLQALRKSEASAIVRVPFLDKYHIEQALNLGAGGIMIPKVNSNQDVNEALDSMYYPPEGNRGVNPLRFKDFFDSAQEYIKNFNSHVISIMQIESQEALDNLEAIAKNNKTDVLFLGVGDLALSFGDPGNFTSKKMNEARKTILNVCMKYNKTPGIFSYDIELAKQYQNEGFTFIALGSDLRCLASKIKKDLDYLKM
jgi:2-keto-3-deoxy-L-rhamnonate aldolase RhmA